MLAGAKPHMSGQRRGVELLGSAASSRSGVQGGAPAAKRFSCILQAPDGLSWNFFGPSSGGHYPLKPAYDYPIM